MDDTLQVLVVEARFYENIADELARLKARRGPTGESAKYCIECEEEIPERRRELVPGVKLCVACQEGRDGADMDRGGINRRGSKGSQMK